MKIWDELGVLEVRNEKGTLRIEQDTDLGALLTIMNPDIALTMVGMYQMEELHYIVNNQSYARIKHGYFSPSIGHKKVLETILVQETMSGLSDYSITFLSVDTTYHFPLTIQQWKEFISLLTYIIEMQ